MTIAKDYDEVTQLFAYEAEELDENSTQELFKHLVASGMIWHLQGSYGREAHRRDLI